MKKKLNILHITTHLGGGVGRVVLNYLELVKYQPLFVHDIASLDYMNDNAKNLLKSLDIKFIENASKDYKALIDNILKYDIILIHWWNHPLMYEFLVKYSLPKCRVIIWSHISGLFAPANFTKPLFKYADQFIFTTPISYESHVVQNLTKKEKEKLDVIWSTAGLKHVQNISNKAHKGFNVGYLGTVDYAKIHKDFLDMSDAIEIDNIKFIVCGGDDEKNIEEESKLKGISPKFDFVGKVNNIDEYLSLFDVFGYPLSPYHFGTCDQVLAEAMACGSVPVVFNNPMENYIVEHNKTGIIVNNNKEYKEAIEKLYKDRVFKNTLSKNAKEAAFKRFSLENMVKEWENIFDKCLAIKKTTKEWDGKYKGIEVTPFQVFLESTEELEQKYTNALFEKDIIKRNGYIDELKKLYHNFSHLKSHTKGTLEHYISFFDDNNLKMLRDLILYEKFKKEII